MKIWILSTILFLLSTVGFSQNIMEALQLKRNLIGEYLIGELMATDTIVDLRNGYYEEYHSFGVGDKTMLQQAAIFRNQDGSSTLGISITEYDFVCFFDKTNFYEIPKSSDTIHMLTTNDALPDLTVRDLVTDTIVSVLNTYLPKLQGGYLDATDTIDKLLSEVYHVAYILPRHGTNLTATLMVCDYIPTNEISIRAEDWAIIENDFLSIELKYDRKRKRFTKP